jgi:hypothetical protein
LELAVSDSGLVAYEVFEGAMDSDDFLSYLEETLVSLYFILSLASADEPISSRSFRDLDRQRIDPSLG